MEKKKYNAILVTRQPAQQQLHAIESKGINISEYFNYIDTFNPSNNDSIPSGISWHAIIICTDIEASMFQDLFDMGLNMKIPVITMGALINTSKDIIIRFMQKTLEASDTDTYNILQGVGERDTVKGVATPRTLQAVNLDKTDTCWTYCLKRIGYPHTVTTNHNLIEQYFDFKELTNNDPRYATNRDYNPELSWLDTLQPGDLLIFTAKESEMLLATSITAEGKLIYDMQKVRRHVVVYEGKGKVSHAIANTTNGLYCMEIEIKHLLDFKHLPTHKLVSKKA